MTSDETMALRRKGEAAAKVLVEALGERCSHHCVDQPDDPTTEWEFVLVVDGTAVETVWTSDGGYGLFAMDDMTRASRPREWHEDAAVAAGRVLAQMARPTPTPAAS